jgi:two-component system cell cycle sensor histidine kinase/response regulator CckA
MGASFPSWTRRTRQGGRIEAIHPDDRDRVSHAALTMQSAGGYEEECRIVRPDGTTRWIRDRAFPVGDSQGQIVRVAGVAEDITHRQELEAQLRHAQKMEAVGRLAGGVAHDFNNILTAISGYTDLVLLGFDGSDPRRDDLLEVRKAAARAASLTRQLLAFSRRQVLQTKVLDLNALVANVHNLLQRTIPENVHIELDLSASLDPIRADPGQLEQVLMTLAVNAADAMPHGGQLRFKTGVSEMDGVSDLRRPTMPPGRYVHLTVSDTGLGMAAQTLARVFEPFFTTKEPGKGTGLGLAMAYGIMKQSGGFIWVSSRQNSGTSFDIYVPAVDEPVEAAISVTRPTEPTRGSETLLLAEDDGAVRRLARSALERYGYVVLEARDGDDAIGIARQHSGIIHMLITDLVMPGLSGHQLSEQVARIQPGIRVLYSSGYTVNKPVNAERGWPILAKPYGPVELLCKVREILDEQLEAH